MTARRKRSLTAAAASGLAAVLAAVGVGACASTPKDEIESALLALSKNAGMRDAGLSRIELTLALDDDGEDEQVAAEATYVRIEASAPGGATRPPIVLIHGTPSSLFTWSPLLFGQGDFEGLPAAFPDRDIYAIDVVGHGVTRTEAPPYSFQRCADWVAGVIEGLELGDVVLVGNSYGGEFVWRAAVDRPDLIGHVVLLDTSGHPRADDEWLPEEEAMRDMSLAKIGYVLNSPDRIRTALEPHFPEGVTEDQIQEIYLVCDNSDNWEAMVDLARDENGTRKDDLKRLTQPTLLLWGAEDEAYGIERFARLFERDIPNSRLVIIERSGHYPQESRPDAVTEHLRDFLAD